MIPRCIFYILSFSKISHQYIIVKNIDLTIIVDISDEIGTCFAEVGDEEVIVENIHFAVLVEVGVVVGPIFAGKFNF